MVNFLKDTRELILDASLLIFSEKGYVSATTLEISKKAGVSEMTLFRHFQTKNNLFLASIKQAMGEFLLEDISADQGIGLSDFIRDLLHEKITTISKHIALIRMLIRESLANTLPKELECTKIISNQVIQRISSYVKQNNLEIDAISFAQMVVGLLLRYAVMETAPKYHKLIRDEQIKYLNNYLNILNI